MAVPTPSLDREVATGRELTDLREREAWLTGQREALAAALDGAPLEVSLGLLVRTATERLGDGVRAAFYLADGDGKALHHVVGMSAAYAEAVEGFENGPESLSCGLATHLGRPVVTADVTLDPLWAPWRWMAETFDYRGCWSFPIHSRRGTYVGTLAIYWRQPREAEPREVELAGLLTQAAGIIIARHVDAQLRERAEAALRETENRFRQFAENSADVLWILDAATMRLLYLSPAFETIWGEPRERVMADLARWAELVHPHDRARARQAMPRLLAGEVVAQEYRIIRPADGAVRWIEDTGFPMPDADGRIRRVAGIAQDVTQRKEGEVALAASEGRLRALVEGIPQLVWRAVDGGQWTWASPQWCAFTGQDEAASRGHGWLERVHPDDRGLAMAAWRGAEQAGAFSVEYRICHARERRYRWFQTRATPVRDQRGAIVEWLGTSTDIHELRLLQERQQLLMAELQHRTRNLLAVVAGVADQTRESAASLDEFLACFSGRLGALGRVQSLLSEQQAGERAALGDLVRLELSAHGVEEGGRIVLAGPEVSLPDEPVQTLALVLHELATNALKHGALATPGSRLSVSWQVARAEGDHGSHAAQARQPSCLVLEWRESGVPLQGPPPRRGYGRELIEDALPYELGARTVFEVGSDGVYCRLELPLGRGHGIGQAGG